jgi:hypothetical protein
MFAINADFTFFIQVFLTVQNIGVTAQTVDSWVPAVDTDCAFFIRIGFAVCDVSVTVSLG